MAADWIQWTKGLARKREVILMASRLGVSRQHLAACLMELWEWCDNEIPDADIDPETLNATVKLGPDAESFLDAQAGLPGLVSQMRAADVDWIQFDGGTITLPRLGLHNGNTAKTRGQAAKRKRRQRAGDDEDPGNSVTNLSRLQRDKNAPREERRDGGESSSFLKFKKTKKKKAREPADDALRIAEIVANVADLEDKPP